jgi:hypothetical protein
MWPVEHTHQLSILNKVKTGPGVKVRALCTSNPLAMQQHIEENEVTMRDEQAQDGPTALVGVSRSEEAILTTHRQAMMHLSSYLKCSSTL